MIRGMHEGIGLYRISPRTSSEANTEYGMPVTSPESQF